jgi:hypothetical protein
MNLEPVEEIEEVGIEKPKKRQMSEKQLANLANGRKKNIEAKSAKKTTKAEEVAKKEIPVVVPEPLEIKAKKTRKSQVIVFADDDDTEEEEDMPKIIIKQKRQPPKRAKSPPPREPSPPPPIPKLRRV